MTILIRFSLFFLLFGLLTACGSDLRGKPAPDFARTDLDSELQSLEKHRGKVVMLYFWADWCPTCKKEFPQTQEYYEELAGEDFELLAINVAQPKEASEVFRGKYGATFPMLTDEKSEITDLYDVEVLPTNYFIDPEGKIIRRIDGFVDKNQARVMVKQHRKGE